MLLDILNAKQYLFLIALQAIRLFLGGRGSGKSFALGVSLLLKAIDLPRSRGALASTTYNQILSKTLKSVKEAWEILGFYENVHYVVGKRPPKDWALPYTTPDTWKNVISWRWGSIVELISLDRPDNARGGSYDYIEVDEAALLEKTDWTKILLPAIRGNVHRYSHQSHQQASFYTSIPWRPSGYWILEFEDKQINKPNKYKVIEATAYDNIEVLKEEGIERMRDEMDHLEFKVEVMNERVKKGKNAFYTKFDADKHSYRPKFRYKETETIDEVLGCVEIDPHNFLEISFDFGGWFNCATVWQQKGNVEYCLKEFYVKGDNTLTDLIRNITTHYKHTCRAARIWGDPRGHDKLPATPTIYEIIKKAFNDLGWSVEVATPKGYQTDKHATRRNIVNDVLEEKDMLYPRLRFNEIDCKQTIIVMQTTEANEKGQKIKTDESNRNYPQENAPHLTDTADYYIIFKYGNVTEVSNTDYEIGTIS